MLLRSVARRDVSFEMWDNWRRRNSAWLTSSCVVQRRTKSMIDCGYIGESWTSSLIQPPSYNQVCDINFQTMKTCQRDPTYIGYPDAPSINVYLGPRRLLIQPAKIAEIAMNMPVTVFILSTVGIWEGWLPPAPRPTRTEFIPITQKLAISRTKVWTKGLPQYIVS